MAKGMTGPNGIIRQSEFFVYSQRDRDAIEKCMELGYDFPEITTWIRATKEDFALAITGPYFNRNLIFVGKFF